MIKQAKVKPHDSESARKLFMNQMPQVNAHRAAYHPEVKKHFATKSLKEDTFAGAMVFEVSSAVFHTAKLEKRKHKTWKKYLEEDDCLAEIREYANKNPGRSIILKNRNTGEMTYARYGKRR